INVRDSARFVVSPDGRVLATAGGTVATKIELWDLTTGLELSQDPAGSLALPLAFSPDGRRLVTQRRVAGIHGSVTVWEAATGKKIKTVDHSGEVQTAALSHDGRMLALQAADRTIVVKDVDTSRVLQQFSLAQSQDTGRTTGFRFSPDSRLLATADSENLVRLWDLHTGREMKAYRGTAVDFGDDGSVNVWQFMTGRKLLSVKPPQGKDEDVRDRTVVSLSSDGSLLAVGLRNRVNLHDVSTGKELWQLTLENPGGLLKKIDQYANPSSWLAKATEYIEGSMRRGQENMRREYWVRALALSPDGKYLATATDRGIYLWDSKRGE